MLTLTDISNHMTCPAGGGGLWQSIQVAGVLLTEAIELHFVFSVALVFHSYRDTNVLARKNC